MWKAPELEFVDSTIDSASRHPRTVRIVVQDSQNSTTRISLLVKDALRFLRSCGGDSIDALVGQKVVIQQKKTGFNWITHIGKDQDNLVSVIH